MPELKPYQGGYEIRWEEPVIIPEVPLISGIVYH